MLTANDDTFQYAYTLGQHHEDEYDYDDDDNGVE